MSASGVKLFNGSKQKQCIACKQKVKVSRVLCTAGLSSAE